MAPNLFSPTIFFVVFREALEAALVVSVLLSLVEQILHKGLPALPDHSNTSTVTAPVDPESNPTTVSPRVLRKLRLQVCTRRHRRHLFSTYFPGHSRCLTRLTDRCRYWRCVHRHLVHPGHKSLVKLGTIMGRHAFLAPSRRKCLDTSSNRHISVDRFCHDLRHGSYHAQNGQCPH